MSTPSSVGDEGTTISINLHDVPLDNQDYGSVGAQTWGGACVMAEMVVESPGRFGLLPLRETSSPLLSRGNHGTRLAGKQCKDAQTGDEEGEIRPKPFRILELGAGTGLVSLAIASFCQHLLNRQTHISQHGSGRRDVEIVATDYHPSVLENLKVNLKSNGFDAVPDETNAVASTSNHSSSTLLNVCLKACLLDLSTLSSAVSSPSSPFSPNDSPLDQLFDMAFGADIVYEEQHAVWFKGRLKKLLYRSLGAAGTIGSAEEGELGDEDPNAYFHLIIPLRPTHTFESGTIETVFKSMPHATNGDPGKDEMQRGTW